MDRCRGGDELPNPDLSFLYRMTSISGKNIEFEENRKIVQKWHFGAQAEDSIVTITLHPDKKGTSVELRHTNISRRI